SVVADVFLHTNGAAAVCQLSGGSSLTASNAIIGPGATLKASGGSQLTLLSGTNNGIIDANGGTVQLGPPFQNNGSILGAPNSWTSSSGGRWETASNWSL